MRHLTLIILTVLFVASPLFAQPPDTLWTRTFGGENSDACESIKPTEDGGYILSGSTFSFGAGARDLWLIKTDENGIEEWNQTYGGDGSETGYDVIQSDDEGYLITGYTNSFGNGEGDLWLLKTDSNGEEIWNNTYGGSDWEIGNKIQGLEDNSVIIVGFTASIGAGGRDAWMLKIDSNGDEVWNQTYGGIGDDYAYDIQKTLDGGFILAGFSNSFGQGGTDIYMIKTDSEGNEEWSQTFGGSEDDYCLTLNRTNDEGYLLTGYTFSFGAGERDLWLIKTDENGTEEWNQTYGSINDEWGIDSKITDDGGYIVCGYRHSADTQRDLWVFKTDANGQEEWDISYGGQLWEDAREIHQTDDGGYIMAGRTGTFGSGSDDFWLVRFGSETTILENDSPIPSEYVLNDIYPNPFNAMTTISVGLPETSDLKISIYNIAGQRVATVANRSCSAGTHKFSFNADDLSSGVYFVHAFVAGKLNQVQKVLLIR